MFFTEYMSDSGQWLYVAIVPSYKAPTRGHEMLRSPRET